MIPLRRILAPLAACALAALALPAVPAGAADLVPQTWIRALTWDGDIYGHGWPEGALVTISVDKPGTADDVSATLTAGACEVCSPDLVWWEGVPGGLQPGDVVTAETQSPAIQRELVVADFGIDTVTFPDTVVGHAFPAGTEVRAFVGSTNGWVTSASDGSWTFVTTADLLVEGDDISAYVTDADGDWTESSFYIRDHQEVSTPGPSNGDFFVTTGQPVTYQGDVWVAYPAAPATFTVAWSWGDGTTSAGTVAFDQGDPIIATAYGSHTYATAGLYSVSVTVSQPGIPAATSPDADPAWVAVFDPKKAVGVGGSATATAENHSGGYYDEAFAGGPVNVSLDVRRAAKTQALSGSVTVAVPGMNGGTGMIFTATSLGLEAIFSNPANAMGPEAMVAAHGTISSPGQPSRAAGALIHVIDRAKAPDLVRVVIWDEEGAGFGILDTVCLPAPGEDPPWTSPPAYQISVAEDQVVSSTIKIK